MTFLEMSGNSHDVLRDIRETLMIFLEMSEKLSWYCQKY